MEENKVLPFPYEFEELKPDEKELVNKTFSPNLVVDRYRVGPKGYIVFKPYKKDAENIYNMPLRTSDVFVASYQRSGTTWTQELVWLVANDLDYAKAAAVPLEQRYPFLDMFMYFDEKLKGEYVNERVREGENVDKVKLMNVIDFLATPVSGRLATAPSPRFIKTHLPMSLLPPTLLDTAKMVYVARDPRDVAVSCYHHSKLFKIMSFPGGFKQFWEVFHKSLFTLTPLFEHIKEAWELRNHPNMLFVFYEDMLKDLSDTINRVASFFGKQLNEEQVVRLCDHLSIQNFKNNKSVNFEEIRELGILASKETFIRKGKAGGWRDYFDEEMTQQAERWIADNLRDTDLRFPHMQL